MPIYDERTRATAFGGQFATSGVITVRYREVTGTRKNAMVIGPGSASGLKLLVDSTRVVDNVAVATTLTGQSGRYSSRH